MGTELSIVNNQLSIINYQLLVPKLSVEKYHQIISKLHPGRSFGNALTVEALPGMETTHYPIPTTQYPLPTTQYPLPTTQYPIPNTF